MIETTIGSLGFSIPAQTLAAGTEIDFTPAQVAEWCQNLPIADLGLVTKSLFHTLSDCNKVVLSPRDRLEILTLFSTPLVLVCNSLNKHFVHQNKKLTKQQLNIAALTQTLHAEMNNGYKIVIEQSIHDTADDVKNYILPTALQKFIYHSSQIILQNYQLYTGIPENIWKELYLAYQVAENKITPLPETFSHEYKRILLLAMSNPYHWDQTEQLAIYKASKTWAALLMLKNEPPDHPVTGVFFADLALDKPPLLFNSTEKKGAVSYQILDVNPILSHLTVLLATLEPNELHAKLAHYHEAEYAVSVPILKGLIKAWQTNPARIQKRESRSLAIHVCLGLMATYYYLNNKQEFHPPQPPEENTNTQTQLPALTVEEDTTDNHPDSIPTPTLNADSFGAYPVYPCTLFDENAQGYGLLWPEGVYPPIQAGTLIGIFLQQENDSHWELGRIRWLQHTNHQQLKLGVERLPGTVHAGAIHMTVTDNTVIHLRGLLLETTILVPILPFKTGDHVQFIQDNAPPINLELTELIDSTGSYKQFSFTTTRTIEEKSVVLAAVELQKKKINENEGEGDGDGDGFDSLWKQL
jgi:hypothetical protein